MLADQPPTNLLVLFQNVTQLWGSPWSGTATTHKLKTAFRFLSIMILIYTLYCTRSGLFSQTVVLIIYVTDMETCDFVVGGGLFVCRPQGCVQFNLMIQTLSCRYDVRI